jgi:TPR repeat protein
VALKLKKMNASGVAVPAVDRAEQIKWWDVVDALSTRWATIQEEVAGTAEMLRLARECRHPDAQWLTSLFPAGVGDGMTRHVMAEMLREHGGGPRTAFVASCAKDAGWMGLLRFAAANGYAPAQARLSASALIPEAEKFRLAQLACAQGDRCGIAQLAHCFRCGVGCEPNKERAVELYKEAALLLDPSALYYYGLLGFGPLDAERYHWWSLAVSRGFGQACRLGIIALLPSFEDGENGRILQVAGPVLKADPGLPKMNPFCQWNPNEKEQALRVIELYETVLGFAQQTITCWGLVGRRCRVVKDIRVMISKMVWEETWRLGAKRALKEKRNAKRAK